MPPTDIGTLTSRCGQSVLGADPSMTEIPTVFFTAGLNGGHDGLFGSLTPVTPGTPLGNLIGVGVPWLGSLAMLTMALAALGLMRGAGNVARHLREAIKALDAPGTENKTTASQAQ